MKNQQLKKWYEDVCFKHVAHETAANIANKWNNRIGFTAIVAGILAGIEIIDFAGNNESFLPFEVLIALSLFAIIAAISNAAVKFFGYETLKQKHKTTSVAYATIKYELETLLMDENKTYSTDIFNKIQSQLSEISANAPLIKESINKKVKKRKGDTLNETPKYYKYDLKLIERWKVNVLDDWNVAKGSLIEIGENPTRSYICEPLETCEYEKSGKIYIENKHIMTRGKDKINSILQGEGILNNNTAFIRYNVSDLGFSTYGNMVINFTNKVEAKGFWMSANLKEARLLIGTIELKKI